MASDHRKRIYRVSNALMAQLLGLPPGAEIVGISEHAYWDVDDHAVKVAHPDFDQVAQLEPCPTCLPVLSPTDNRFLGWGEPA